MDSQEPHPLSLRTHCVHSAHAYTLPADTGNRALWHAGKAEFSTFVLEL